ncbi:MAG: CRISPR-associated endonuclease Cas1, partial [Marinospirillum sp.]|uniref:CRISPR-associated endonuclease Cas1 n=1 Tax=Marinospirillum sp. TaxID=2183934 RepID=UPI0019D8265E
MTQHLIIDHKDTRLELEGLALKIHRPDRKPSSIPLRLLEQVTLIANIDIPIHLLHQLAQHDISVAVLNPRNQSMMTECINFTHKAYQRRAKQYALIHDTQAGIQASRELMEAKLKSQASHLEQLVQLQPKHRGLVQQKRKAISALQSGLHSAGSEELLGIEGSAARHYFEGYRSFFADSWAFTGRNKRPPKDPVNSLLSLSYSLLIREASHALQ